MSGSCADERRPGVETGVPRCHGWVRAQCLGSRRTDGLCVVSEMMGGGSNAIAAKMAGMTYDSTTKPDNREEREEQERAGAESEVRKRKKKRRWSPSRSYASHQGPSAYRPPSPRPFRTQVRPFPTRKSRQGDNSC